MDEDELESLRDRVCAMESVLGATSHDAVLALDYAARDPKGAAHKAGLVTEAMLDRLHRELLGVPPRRRASIQELVEALGPRLPENIRAHIDHVQRFRNAGSHVSRMEVHPGDLSIVLNAFVRIVEWYVETLGPANASAPGLRRVRISRVRWRRLSLLALVACSALLAWIATRQAHVSPHSPAFFEASGGARRVRAPLSDAACPAGQLAFRIVGEARAVAALASAGRCIVADTSLHCCAP